MPAKSKAQQRLFGMVHAYQKGKLKHAPASVKRIAKHISKEDARHFAETKHDDLPERKEAAYVEGFLSKCAEYGLTFNEAESLLEKTAGPWWASPLSAAARFGRKIGKGFTARSRATLSARRWSHMANAYGRLAQEAVDKGAANASEAVARHKSTLGMLNRFENRFGRLVDYSGKKMDIEPIRMFPYERHGII